MFVCVFAFVVFGVCVCVCVCVCVLFCFLFCCCFYMWLTFWLNTASFGEFFSSVTFQIAYLKQNVFKFLFTTNAYSPYKNYLTFSASGSEM